MCQCVAYASDKYSLSKLICNACNETDVNAVFIKEAKHTSNTHLGNSKHSGKLPRNTIM